MKIIPLANKIQLKIEKPTAGGLDLSSKATATEVAEVMAIGEDVVKIKVGDVIMFKSWSTDIITYEGKIYYFITDNSDGICAVIKK